MSPAQARTRGGEEEVEGVVAEDTDHDGDAEEDCDEGDAAIHPGADDLCDGVDYDCDGEVDEDVELTYYADEDGDGFGNCEETRSGCVVSAVW